MPRRLGVNIDHVATLREARKSPYPDPVLAALMAEQSGADQITCHLRCDRRHVNERDIRLLRDTVCTHLNVECAVTREMLDIMLDLKPHRVTLVPERPRRSHHGRRVTNPLAFEAEIRSGALELSEAGIGVSLFIDPDLEQVEISAMPGVDMIELNTARYAEDDPAVELVRLKNATDLGLGLGLEVAAGHGLTHLNLPALVEAVPEIVEYNIGHSIVSRAVFVGLDTAVRDLVTIIR